MNKYLKLLLRWIVFGWWAVPLLFMCLVVVSALECWTGDATEVYWTSDDDFQKAFNWFCNKLALFFSV